MYKIKVYTIHTFNYPKTISTSTLSIGSQMNVSCMLLMQIQKLYKKKESNRIRRWKKKWSSTRKCNPNIMILISSIESPVLQHKWVIFKQWYLADLIPGSGCFENISIPWQRTNLTKCYFTTGIAFLWSCPEEKLTW